MPQLKQLDVLNEKPQTKSREAVVLIDLGIGRRVSSCCSHGLVGLFGHVLTEADLYATPAPSGTRF